MDRLRVGVIGCGKISGVYLQNLTGPFADRVEVRAVADLAAANAEGRAKECNIPRACSPVELLSDPEIELALNLTPATAHHAVNLQVLRAGKHLYSEKPLALSLDAGREIVRAAEERGLRLACAPDTLLGAGVQTCRKAIDEGKIGTPTSAQGFVSIHGRSEAYHTVFRGPLLDLAPYHVGAMIIMLGPVRAVSGVVRPRRVWPGEPEMSPAARTMDNPATSAAVLEFESGCLGTLIATSESWGYQPSLTVYGYQGTLSVPDPNMFSAPVSFRPADKPAEDYPLTHAYTENSRGIGVWDMAGAIRDRRPHRLGADLALHELEVMLSVIESSKTGRRVELTTRCDRGEAMPAG